MRNSFAGKGDLSQGQMPMRQEQVFLVGRWTHGSGNYFPQNVYQRPFFSEQPVSCLTIPL